MECRQYTIRGVPGYLDSGLRGYAREESKSLNAVLLELLERGLSVFRQRPKNAELLELAGTWVEDPDAEKALEEIRTIDEDLWK